MVRDHRHVHVSFFSALTHEPIDIEINTASSLPMLKKNIAFVIMLTFLALTYLLLAIGSWNQKQP